MAYQTGNAATIQVLLGKLADFANGLQWKIKKHTETQLYLSNSREDSHWAIEFLSNNVYTIPCTHFDLEKSAIAQPGSPCIENNAYQKVYTRTTELQNGQFVSYDFFGTSEYLHIVVEIEAERFRHFGIGNLLKEIEFTGGQYAYSTYMYSQSEASSNSQLCTYGMGHGYNGTQAVLRADNLGGDTHSPRYFAAMSSYYSESKRKQELGFAFYGLGRAAMANEVYSYHPDKWLVYYSQSKFGQTLIPAPNVILGHLLNNTIVRFGTVPDRYECKMVGIPPKTILEINGERWKIIPSAGFNGLNQANNTTNPDNTGVQGVAYRLVE